MLGQTDGRGPGRPGVAILTGHGGPVLAGPGGKRRAPGPCCDPHRPRGAGAGREPSPSESPEQRVAILTGHGGRCWPDLVRILQLLHAELRSSPATGAGAGSSSPTASRRSPGKLRSSPATGGRCWGSPDSARSLSSLTLRSSPATGGRCWPVVVPTSTPGALRVAILTGHGGPVLGGEPLDVLADGELVAMLTGHGGPVLVARVLVAVRYRPSVAILTGHGGPVLAPSSPSARRVPCVAILTGHGGPVLGAVVDPGCPPPRGAGAGEGSGWQVTTLTRLRSSPATGGRCWPPCAW